MESRKLTYFPLPALGEPIKYLLVYSNIDFEDIKIPLMTWMEVKNDFPFGQLPIYEENGKVVNQSVAIMRYLGKKCKLNGNNDWEDLEIDAIADTIKDLINKLIGGHYTKSASQQKLLQESILNDTLPFYMKKLDVVAKENNGHMACKRLTWVDFYVAGALNYFFSFPFIKKDLWEENPHLKAVRENVLMLPSIKDFRQKNPEDQKAIMDWFQFSGKPTLP
nr:glutathione S-transferase-like [Onthophagus taurus]